MLLFVIFLQRVESASACSDGKRLIISAAFFVLHYLFSHIKKNCV